MAVLAELTGLECLKLANCRMTQVRFGDLQLKIVGVVLQEVGCSSLLMPLHTSEGWSA